MSNRVLLPAFIVVATVLSLTACGKKDEQDKGRGARGAATVGVMVVQSRPLNLTQELTGRTSAWLVSDVRPQVGGIVKTRQFSEGALVTAGQSLYQIDPATYQADFDSAVAAEQQAQATLDAANLRFERAQQLITIRAISQQDFDDARAAAKQATAQLASQKAAVQQARIALGYTKVAAPVSGRIGRSTVTPGALVTANQATALATIQDLSKIYVDITQSSAEMVRLKRDIASGTVGAVDHADVTLTLDDGSPYPVKGRVQFSDVTVDPATGSVTLRAVFDNPDGLLLPGMFVRARIVKGTVSEGILVPQPAVVLDPKGGASVMIAGPDNKAQKRDIQLGEMIGKEWRVVSGLKPGDKVIVEGAANVKDKGPIKPRAVTPGAAAEK
jgi:membrane fusion protein, multidrug efflux system